MQAPPRSSPRESTPVMAANIGRELRELRAVLAHLLFCSCELLQNLLIDTASRPRRIER